MKKRRAFTLSLNRWGKLVLPVQFRLPRSLRFRRYQKRVGR